MTRSRRAGLSRDQARQQPLYARMLGLQYLAPSGFLCFAFLEGAVALGFLLALAELVSWWGVLVLPVTVAVMVKLNDVVAGVLIRPAVRERARALSDPSARPRARAGAAGASGPLNGAGSAVPASGPAAFTGGPAAFTGGPAAFVGGPAAPTGGSAALAGGVAGSSGGAVGLSRGPAGSAERAAGWLGGAAGSVGGAGLSSSAPGLEGYSGRRPYLRDAGIPGDRGGSPDDLSGAPGDSPAAGASRFSGDPRTCGEPRVFGPFSASAAPSPATPASYASAADAYDPDVPALAASASDGPGGATVRLPAPSSTQAGGPIWADGPPPLRPAVAREMPTTEPAQPSADGSDRWPHPPIDASPLNGPPAVRHWTEPLDDTQRRARQSAARRYE